MAIDATQVQASIDNGLVGDGAAVATRCAERSIVLREYFVGLPVDDSTHGVGLMMRIVFDVEQVTDDGRHGVRGKARMLHTRQQSQRFVDFPRFRIEETQAFAKKIAMSRPP